MVVFRIKMPYGDKPGGFAERAEKPLSWCIHTKKVDYPFPTFPGAFSIKYKYHNPLTKPCYAMARIFTHITGCFAFDENGRIIDRMLAKAGEKPEELEKRMHQKHKGAEIVTVPTAAMMQELRKEDLAALLFERNLKKAKDDIRASVKKDVLIIQAIRNIDNLNKVINLMCKRLREWYGLCMPELVRKSQTTSGS